MRGIADALNRWLRRVPVWPWYVIGFAPAALWLRAGLLNALGPDPARALEQNLGLTALQLLIAALAVTPLRELTGVSFLRFRRMIGLMAFYYLLLHLAAWVVFDRGMDLAAALTDIVKRPYIVVGMTALVLLLPVALTSTDRAIRSLGGARWRALHRLVYPATALGAVHFVWLVKAWPPEPLVYAGIVAALLLYRLLPRRGRVRTLARPA
ncbi:protein-methionine-sulfoxide reductase heme-binding subunit MsrQ [Amaricoccus solimangrovi]|uniref:Protein-methionine-sulfoxide reductase heme-binding subunit MsrQ n=1 Tax=Amaricoccus solimangrovi TaxID=2589815 RepID=A0A501WLT1_9RHOB|nr:protein-methionine-sulfoxide reductase heme-binding subunit MsrQ [Amaricoccus solimangrovi]TPE47991.1 protein-methionine-sulfoxide reductase heme-binding subunit MsrQ [Amaricoccus solimangrovi]